MKLPSPHELLELWERGSRLHPLDQGLLALRAGLPDGSPEIVADWPLGRRNRALLEQHSACFGSRLQAWVECTACGEKMEFEVDAQAVLDRSGPPPPQDATVEVDGHSLRLPTSRDLAQAARETDPAEGAMCIVRTCCVDQAPGVWTAEDLIAAGTAMASADPLAELRLALACPGCGNVQEETLDPVTFVWSELGTLAKRLLHDVHTLAAAYGWSEQEILNLSDFRRSQYVQRVHA